MRARNIKPGFFKNEDLAELDPLARVLFIGLWCFADREGRFEWRPKRIKAEILPYDDCDIECLLMSLHDTAFIYRYGQYGFIPKFKQHQNPHPHEAKSKLPSPDEEKCQQNQCHDMSVTSNEMSVASQADSGSLIPDIRNPEKKKSTSSAPAKKTGYTDEFEKFWRAYPKKVGKGAAYKAWSRINGKRPKTNELVEIIEKHKQSRQWKLKQGQFIPNPQTWLNQERWLDELEATNNQRDEIQF